MLISNNICAMLKYYHEKKYQKLQTRSVLTRLRAKPSFQESQTASKSNGEANLLSP